MRRSCFALPWSLLMALLAGTAMATSPADERNDSQYGHEMPNYGDDEMQCADDGDYDDAQSEPSYGSWNDQEGNGQTEQLMDEFAPTESSALPQELAISHWNREPAPQELLEAAEQRSDYRGCNVGLRGPNDGYPESDEDAQSAEPDDSAAEEISDRGEEPTGLSEEDRSYEGSEAAEDAEDTDERSEYSDEEEMYGDVDPAGQEADEISDDDADSNPYQFGSFEPYGSETGYQASDEYEDESQEQWDEESSSQSEEEIAAWQTEEDVEDQDSAWQSEEQSTWQGDEEEEEDSAWDGGEKEDDSAWDDGGAEEGNVQRGYGQWSDEDEAEDSEGNEAGVVETPAIEWSMLNAVKSWAVRQLGGLGEAFCSIAPQVSVVQWLAASAVGNSRWTAGYGKSSPEKFEF